MVRRVIWLLIWVTGAPSILLCTIFFNTCRIPSKTSVDLFGCESVKSGSSHLTWFGNVAGPYGPTSVEHPVPEKVRLALLAPAVLFSR